MNEEDEIFLHEMINTMIYIYLAISSGMEKNPTYIYIFHRAKLSNLDVNGVFSTAIYHAAIAIRPTKTRWGLVDFLWSIMDFLAPA